MVTATRLTAEQKIFIVQALARFETPLEVAGAVRETFGIKITPQRAENYDPTKRAGERLSERWRELFFETRQRFMDSLEDIPEAHKAVRVRHLALAARRFKSRGNYVGMKEMLEAIAKEMGNVHTNRREFTGKDGKPMELQYSDMTDKQLTARLVQLMGQVMEGEGGEIYNRE